MLWSLWILCLRNHFQSPNPWSTDRSQFAPMCRRPSRNGDGVKPKDFAKTWCSCFDSKGPDRSTYVLTMPLGQWIDWTWQNIRRHEDLENAIFTCSGWLFEHKVSFKYSASGEEANTVRLFSSVTVVSMGWLLTFRKADHEANPIPGCGNCAAAVISY